MKRPAVGVVVVVGPTQELFAVGSVVGKRGVGVLGDHLDAVDLCGEVGFVGFAVPGQRRAGVQPAADDQLLGLAVDLVPRVHLRADAAKNDRRATRVVPDVAVERAGVVEVHGAVDLTHEVAPVSVAALNPPHRCHRLHVLGQHPARVADGQQVCKCVPAAAGARRTTAAGDGQCRRAATISPTMGERRPARWRRTVPDRIRW